MVIARMCKLCGQGFELEYSRAGGRPRDYCFTCQPEGWKIVLPKHRFGRVKLRRLRPLQGLAKLTAPPDTGSSKGRSDTLDELRARRAKRLERP